ncbi:hypothetical protein J6U78_03730 [bacterium]|nr:hypothetical protein [bacterium]
MTNKEAINVLKSKFEDLLKGEFMTLFNRHESDFDLAPAEDGKAIDLAIKALEREEGCKDISDWPSSYFQCSECENIVCDEMETKINYCPNCGRRVEQ